MKDLFISRNFRFMCLWLGQILSQSGTRMFQIAIVWSLISLETEHAGVRAAIFMVLGAIPSIIFLKWTGRFIDQQGAKIALLGSDSCAACISLALWLLLGIYGFNISFIYGAGFLLATCHTFLDPSLQKALPQLVHSEKDTEKAVAWIATTQSLASFGGAVVGAFAINQFNLETVTLLNAISYIISVLFLLAARIPEVIYLEKTNGSNSGSQVNDDALNVDESVWNVMAKRVPLLLKIIIGFGVINFFATPTLIVLPLYIKKNFNGSASLLAVYEALLWLGMIIGTFSLAWVKRLCSVMKIQGTLKFGGCCLLLFGLCLWVPGLFVDLHIYGLLLGLAGFTLGLNNVKFVTLFQEVVVYSRKGRFFALLGALISFSFPFAYLVFGFLADVMAITTLCFIQGLGVMTLALWYFAISHREHELYVSW